MPGLLRDTLKHLGGQGGALLQKQAYILPLFRLRGKALILHQDATGEQRRGGNGKGFRVPSGLLIGELDRAVQQRLFCAGSSVFKTAGCARIYSK